MFRRLSSLALVLVASSLVACNSPPYLAARVPVTAATVPAGVEHVTGSFPGAKNTRLFEQYWRPATGPVRGALVVMHGLKDHSDRYADLAARLVEDGFAVYAFDLPGHGHSEGTRVYIDSFDDYVDDLDAFVGKVRAHEPGVPVFIFGHSMGGAIVTRYALKRRPNLQGLILSGAALKANVSGFKVFGTKTVAAISPRAGVFNLDLEDFSRDPAVVRAGQSDPLVYQDGAPARTAKELLNAIDDNEEHMEEMTVPILIMHGGADKVTDPDGSRELHRRARSRDKSLTIFDGLYHDLLHEPEKERVMSTIATWLEARAPRPAQ